MQVMRSTLDEELFSEFVQLFRSITKSFCIKEDILLLLDSLHGRLFVDIKLSDVLDCAQTALLSTLKVDFQIITSQLGAVSVRRSVWSGYVSTNEMTNKN